MGLKWPACKKAKELWGGGEAEKFSFLFPPAIVSFFLWEMGDRILILLVPPSTSPPHFKPEDKSRDLPPRTRHFFPNSP